MPWAVAGTTLKAFRKNLPYLNIGYVQLCILYTHVYGYNIAKVNSPAFCHLPPKLIFIMSINVEEMGKVDSGVFPSEIN